MKLNETRHKGIVYLHHWRRQGRVLAAVINNCFGCRLVINRWPNSTETALGYGCEKAPQIIFVSII